MVVAAGTVIYVLKSGSSSTTGGTATAATTTTLTPNPLLVSELAAQRAGVDGAINTYETNPSDGSDVAVYDAQSLGKAMNTYVAFLNAQSWPANLQPTVNADVSAWNQTATPIANLAGQTASTLSANAISTDLRTYHAALLTAYAADAVLQRDASNVLCGNTETNNLCGP